MAEVILKLSQPNKLSGEIKADKIVLPAVKGDLTVLPRRAPLSLLLRNGQVKLLDQDNRITCRYFVQGGVADVAEDVCQVTSPRIVLSDEMTREAARQRLEAAVTPEDRDYYQMMIDEFDLFEKSK